MSQNIHDRVSEAINKSHRSVTDMSESVGVSRKTIYRWRDKETDKFSDEKLKALADYLGIREEWLVHGIKPKFKDDNLNRIESSINNQSSEHKGMDQTLLNVELKAKSLIQDLQSLLDQIQDLKRF